MKNIYLSILFLTFTTLTFGQWGELDPTFGDTGKVTTNIGSGFDNAADIIQQSDGKLIVVGSGTETTTSILVARYEVDGTIDNTFGTNGMTLIQVSSITNYGMKGAFQSDGKILIGARTGDGVYNDFTCIRLNSDGSIDDGFASNGIFTISLNENVDNLNDLKVLDDDKIILAGTAGPDLGEDFALVKLNSNGTLDNTFGDAGISLHNVNGRFDRLESIAIKSDGKIIGAGNIYDETRVLIAAVMQFNANGSMDETFGTNGITTVSPGPYASFFNDVVINEDNTIVAAGVLDYDSQYDFLAVKFNEDGSVYDQFAEDGFFINDNDGISDFARSLLLQPDGKLVLVGSQGTWPISDFALLRITEDGALDDSFGDDGFVTTDIDGGFDYTTGSAIQQDGKILACGASSLDSDYALAMSRYTSGLQVGIEDRTSYTMKVNAYPNPVVSNMTLRLNLEQNDKVDISVFDISGKMTKEILSNNKLNKGQQVVNVNLSGLNQGLYFLKIKTSNAINTIKVYKL